MELKRCTRCVLPETHETIMFNDNGVCNICQQQEHKQTQIDWTAKKKDLGELIESFRGKYDYDCIVPFSGGKDSVWTLYYLMKEYGVKPLVVRFDHGFLRPNIQENTIRVLRKLGVDFHHFTPNWKVVQKLMLQTFLEKGDFCWHCHTGIFSYPMWVAVRYNVPLIFWGEPSAEYTSYYSYDQPEEVDEKRFNRFVNLGINAEDMFVRLAGDVEERDLKPFTYPPLKELRRINYRSVCLGSYVPWDVKTAVADHPGGTRLEGRRGGERPAGIQLREDRVLHAGRARLHQVHQARLHPAFASGLDRHPESPDEPRGGARTDQGLRRQAAAEPRPVPRFHRPD